jgi:hypothetical protein
MYRTQLRRRLQAAALVAVGALALAACGAGSSGGSPTGDSSSGPPSATPATSAPATTTASPSARDLPAPISTAAQQSGSMSDPAALLVSIRTAHHATYDRVVFEFSGKAPGYRVAYVPQVTTDGEGAPVALKGDHFLQVAFQGATLDRSLQGGTGSYTGPKRLTPMLPAVQEIAFAGDFESVLSWGIGVDGAQGFRVLRLASPTRVVIDVATG